MPVKRRKEKKFFNPTNSRPACRGHPGEESRDRQENNMIPDLVSSNEIKETESEGERKEVGIQFTILNTASHPMINSSA